jgi:hypothetical protein
MHLLNFKLHLNMPNNSSCQLAIPQYPIQISSEIPACGKELRDFRISHSFPRTVFLGEESGAGEFQVEMNLITSHPTISCLLRSMCLKHNMMYTCQGRARM